MPATATLPVSTRPVSWRSSPGLTRAHAVPDDCRFALCGRQSNLWLLDQQVERCRTCTAYNLSPNRGQIIASTLTRRVVST